MVSGVCEQVCSGSGVWCESRKGGSEQEIVLPPHPLMDHLDSRRECAQMCECERAGERKRNSAKGQQWGHTHTAAATQTGD